jgi:hypothetical protein
MDDAIKTLTRWCERHPAWVWACSSYPDTTDETRDLWICRMTLGCSRETLTSQYMWSDLWVQNSRSMNPLPIFLEERAYRLTLAAERWIENNTNEGGGCTPTRME